jgi:hypothetical protein
LRRGKRLYSLYRANFKLVTHGWIISSKTKGHALTPICSLLPFSVFACCALYLGGSVANAGWVHWVMGDLVGRRPPSLYSCRKQYHKYVFVLLATS